MPPKYHVGARNAIQKCQGQPYFVQGRSSALEPSGWHGLGRFGLLIKGVNQGVKRSKGGQNGHRQCFQEKSRIACGRTWGEDIP